MSKQTLLEMVQNILARMDSDEVNSITDTAESRQVAQIIKTCFYNIVARADLPEYKKLFQLVGSAEDTTPVLMTRPSNVSYIEWIKYNKEEVDGEDNYSYVTILPIQQYLDMIHQLDVTVDNVSTMTLNGVTYAYETDRHPMYCTIVDDNYIIFNSFDEEFDTTLQSSNSLAFGLTLPHFELADTFIPDLDEQQFMLLLNEATGSCFVDLKQMPNERVEREARRQWVTLQRTKKLDRPSDFNRLPNFGRR